MATDYYTQELFIPQVDENDTIIGTVERWKAHQDGILHRGFTIGLVYQDQFLCQLRRHPVFGGFIDLTASSHQLYDSDGKLASIEEAIEACLQREWHIGLSDLTGEIIHKGSAIYHSTHGKYTEHEVCHYYTASIGQLPSFDNEFAYGYGLFSRDELRDEAIPLSRALAPWVDAAFMDGLF